MSEPKQVTKHSIGWIPWFFVTEPVTIGNVIFRPFGQEHLLPGCDRSREAELLEVMKRFIHINGEPMPSLVIVLWKDDMMFPHLGQEQWDEMIQAVQLLGLANYAINEYFTPQTFDPHYVNSSMFQFFRQNYERGSPHTGIVTRRPQPKRPIADSWMR